MRRKRWKMKLQKLTEEGINDKELTKIQNKTESAIAFEDMNLMARCNSLAFYELLGDAALFNSDREKYFSVTAKDILEYSRTMLNGIIQIRCVTIAKIKICRQQKKEQRRIERLYQKLNFQLNSTFSFRHVQDIL